MLIKLFILRALHLLPQFISEYYVFISITLIDQLFAFLAITFFRSFIKFNSGFAFGIDLQIVGFNISKLVNFLIVSIFILTFTLAFKKNSESVGFKLVLAGALSNLIFRIFYGGYVVDYLSLQVLSPIFTNWQYVWFNIGDVSVVVGTVALFISVVKQPHSHV